MSLYDGKLQHITETIGNTPLVKLGKVGRDVEAEVYVKVEYLNPSGSIKDRIALRMITDAENEGALRPGMQIIEASTGNTATALAFVGAVKGYRVRVYVPSAAASEERLRIAKSYGALVTAVDIADQSSGGLHGSRSEILPRARCKQVEQDEPSDVWWARQFSNPSNAAAHEEGTGREIIKQTLGKVDAFVAAIGTGGTLLGVARALKKQNPGVEIVAVEPKESSIFDDNGDLSIPIIEGITGGLLLDMVMEKTVTRIVRIREQDAIAMAHRLAEEEGLFCGLSSGANVLAALQIARELGKAKCVVTVLVDSRDRYLFREKLTT